MTVAFYTNPLPVAWSPRDQFLRGSERAVMEHARLLATRGYEVTVYGTVRPGEYDDVDYLPYSAFSNDQDVLVVFKVAKLLDQPLNGRVFYWTNEVEAKNLLTPSRLAKVERVIAISNWQRDHLLAGVPKVVVIPHGITPGFPIVERDPNLCLYSSSPDRGLSLLLELWPEVVRSIPEARLEVSYDPPRSEAEMRDLYARSSLWLHPCTGIELCCISALEAQAAGAIPVVIPAMALQETVRYGVKTDASHFATEVIALLKDTASQETIRSQMMAAAHETWETATDKLESLWHTN